MPEPIIAVGLIVEAQPVGPPAGLWSPIGDVVSISGSEYSKQYSEITGKGDTVIQEFPGLVSPGNISFRLIHSTTGNANWLAWRQALQFGAKYNVRVNCGPGNPMAHFINFANCTVSGLSVPQPEGDVVMFTLSFKLHE